MMEPRLGLSYNSGSGEGPVGMVTLLLILEGLFCLKIVWNLLTPYVLAMRTLRTDAKRTKGISLAPGVEIALFVLALAISCVVDGSPFQKPKSIALWGIAMIVASYAHFVVGGAVAGWIVSLLKRRGRSS
jgi:hypothetical protein